MPDSRAARAAAIEELLEADRKKAAPKKPATTQVAKATPVKKASGVTKK